MPKFLLISILNLEPYPDLPLQDNSKEKRLLRCGKNGLNGMKIIDPIKLVQQNLSFKKYIHQENIDMQEKINKDILF